MQRRARQPRSERRRFLVFLAQLALAVVLIRSLIAAPFSIPSESMLPALMPGDYLLATKYDYGWSRFSFPGGGPPIGGRLLGAMPARGDVVIFRASQGDRRDIVKRVIGLPGDRILVRDGALVLNGAPVPRTRIADFVHPASPNAPCAARRFTERRDGRAVCRYPRYRETLPGGRSYPVLDLGPAFADSAGPYRVPAGHVFLLGDHRDRSADSRGAIGFVPVERLVGRWAVTLFSTDGSAHWSDPASWGKAARWNRVGGRE